jgi:hypothetical protein
MANNYIMPPVNPSSSFAEAMQMVQLINKSSDRNEARRLASEQAAAAQSAAQAKAAEQARLNKEFGTALKTAHDDPTAENYIKLADLHATHNPEKAKAFRENWNALEESRQQATFRDAVNTLTALETDPGYGISQMQAQMEAEKNAGNMNGAKKYQTMIDMINVGPVGLQSVKDSLVTTIGMLPNGKEALAGVVNYAKEKRDAAAEPTVQKKRLADIGFTEAQTNKFIAETRKLGIESDKMLEEIEATKKAIPKPMQLSSDAEKLVNNSVMAAAKANSLVRQYSTLSTDFEKAISTAGVGAKVSEQINRILGTEKQPTALRQEYLRMRNTAVLEMLPPGVASDKDVELALAAFPTETSSPSNISGFLRGMAKLQSYEASVESAKAEWIQQNGNLGTARTPMQVGNKEVPKGAKFTEFVQEYIPNTSVIGTKQPVVEAGF